MALNQLKARLACFFYGHLTDYEWKTVLGQTVGLRACPRCQGSDIQLLETTDFSKMDDETLKRFIEQCQVALRGLKSSPSS